MGNLKSSKHNREIIYRNIKPIGFWKSTLYFGIPGISIYLSMYYFVPMLMEQNVSEAVGVMGSMWIITIPMILIGIIFYGRKCDSFTLKGFMIYFNFKKLRRCDGKYISIGILVSILAEGILSPLGKYFAGFSIFSPPDYLSPPFNPLFELSIPIESFMGINLEGNWLFLFLFITLHLLAMLGEEIIWRGYLLPRQIEKYGSKAWILNGILWAWLMHCCLKWNFISMLPSMLITPFMAQKSNSTTVSYIIHVVPNMIVWILILIGVMHV